MCLTHNGRMKGMKNKRKIIKVTIAAVVALVMVIAGYAVYKNSDAVRVREQLDLGEKYLAELDYDQAIVACEIVIEIEPMNVGAYLGLADAYIGKGDYESAALALQKGYDLTKDEAIKNKLDEVNVEVEKIRLEEMARATKEEIYLTEETKNEENNKLNIELPMISLKFELTEFKIFGYDLFTDHFDDICMILGCPSNSEFDRSMVKYGETFDGEIFVRCEEDERTISFVDLWGLSSNNCSGYEVYNNAHIIMWSYIYDKNCEENYVSADFFEAPVLVGDSYDKWYQLFDWDEINESASQEENEIEIKYSFQTKWGSANYSAGKDKELYGDQLDIFLLNDENGPKFSIWVCTDKNNIITQLYVGNYF